MNRCDGQIKYVMIKLIPTIRKGREVFQIQIRDLTDQKKAEEMMDRTEKLSVVGQLAASIAHEIRNPLTVIKGFIQILNQMGNIRYLDLVLEELKRIEDIINDLLILAQPQSSKMEKLNVQELLESTIALFQSEALLHNIDIQTNIDLADPILQGEANRLKQVLINILKNVSEAMPDGGKIHLSARNLEDGRIEIRIKDNGPGIPEERMQNLGQPFYSTKEKGTGLGLMICQRIIKNHGGTMEIKSKVNEGTTINIVLPAKGSHLSHNGED
ncbi:ATP-binding protein [Lederbergia sp. NSJ-179]|uniref:ATP-binding protein n=1 Tax=Lederbergia sp. NSJ-179 TaxID=2931402 RepID=UPI001FD349B5|nr:ATP-binding protein [Lederbergia sp. NSJ-179]MCJ7841794.1 ATP-binding protein [Lederbergia sp. NSJ-179]